jgi:hypothetical protein
MGGDGEQYAWSVAGARQSRFKPDRGRYVQRGLRWVRGGEVPSAVFCFVPDVSRTVYGSAGGFDTQIQVVSILFGLTAQPGSPYRDHGRDHCPTR